MKQLHVLYSNNTNQLFKYSLKQIAPFVQDLSKENIIVVPDKLSLATEQEIFDALNIEVYYNIAVMGISKFASKIIEENNLEFLQCSSQEAKLLVMRAIQNVCKNFKCFSKSYTLGFVDEMYAKIEQIKSSDANIDDLVDENASQGTKLKFEDIKQIFLEYEKLRAGKIDSGELLTIFNEVCKQSDSLKNCNVFFVGFDSLTKQGLNALKNVVQNANYTSISITYAKGQNNDRIYDQTFFDSVINLCKQEKIECNPQYISLPFGDQDKNLILNNMFSRKQQFEQENNYFQIVKANSSLEEIELCVKQINYILKTSNTKFSDIAICSDSSYFNILTSELEKLGISVYADSQIAFENLEPIKFLLNVMEFIESKNVKHIYHILDNDYCGFDKEISEEFLTQLKACGYINYVDLHDDKYKDILNFVNDLNDCKITKNDSIENYIEFIKKLIEKYKIIEKNNKKCEIFEQNGEILLNKSYLQIEKKLFDCFKILENALNNINLSFEEFFEIFKKVLSETKINIVPACVNQIFIGDLKSFYLNKKYLFILGMNEGVLPSVIVDTGLISDKEINSQSIKAKLEPTTKIINKRNKFKLFENILSATQKCYMFFHSFGADNKNAQPNEFVSELLYLFDNQQISSQSLKSLFDSSDDKKLCFNLVDNYNANLMLKNELNTKVYAVIKNALIQNKALFSVCKNAFCEDFDISKLFFMDNKSSISVIEKYNSCPKSAYLANALKLQPVKKDKVEANIIGSFLHEIGERFVKYNKSKLGTMTKENIELSVNKIFEQSLTNQDYYALTLPNNSFLVGLLRAEALRFCTFLNYEQSVSEFKPLYVEKYFGKNSDFLPIELSVEDKKYTISGIVDRIDATDDEFRIIDYKTGNTTNASGVEKLYYGTKIQLFVYAFGVKQNLNKKFFGAFYLPIKNGFSKDGEEQYVLSGFFENDSASAVKCDQNLLIDGKSKIINASFLKVKEDGELNLKKKVNILPKEQLDSYLNYSIKLVEQTIKDIQSGYIECSPISGKCKICEFNNICKFAFDEKIERTEKYNVSPEQINQLFGGQAE